MLDLLQAGECTSNCLSSCGLSARKDKIGAYALPMAAPSRGLTRPATPRAALPRPVGVTMGGASVYNCAPHAVTFITTQQSMTRLLAGAPTRRQPGRFTQPRRVGIIEELA